MAADGMTRAVRDDLARLAYALAHDLPKSDAKSILGGIFATQHDITPDIAWALYVRGKHLAAAAKMKEAVRA